MSFWIERAGSNVGRLKQSLEAGLTEPYKGIIMPVLEKGLDALGHKDGEGIAVKANGSFSTSGGKVEIEIKKYADSQWVDGKDGTDNPVKPD